MVEKFMVEKLWVENFILVLGLNCLGLKLGVENSGVEISCNRCNNFCSPGIKQMIPINIFFQLNVLVVLMVNVSNLMSASKTKRFTFFVSMDPNKCGRRKKPVGGK